MMRLSEEIKHSGFVAIVGRPNVGKSSLLNAILKRKVVITSKRPQTTRHAIQGIKTSEDVQTIYVDTPGIHLKEQKVLNQWMNRSAKQAMQEVDAVVFVVEACRFNQEDEHVLNYLKKLSCPVILAINKVDLIHDKEKLLPYIEQISEKMPFKAVVPISVLKQKKSIELLEQQINALMPEGVFYFPPDQVLNRDTRFQLSEIMREQLMRTLAQELPHAVTVEVEALSYEEGQYQVAVVIWVERESQKPIVIGEKGARLKQMGTKARKAMSEWLGGPVFLQTWVKVKEHWTDNAKALRSLGYDSDSED